MFIRNSLAAQQRLIKEYFKHNNLVIGVDFDGTLLDTFEEGDKNTQKEINKLVKKLKALQTDFNCTLCVWTANCDEEKVRQHWDALGLKVDYYNESPVKKSHFNSVKPYFNILLDDRAGLDSSYTQIKILLKVLKKHHKEYLNK